MALQAICAGLAGQGAQGVVLGCTCRLYTSRQLIVTNTQSGETADTLAALRHAQSLDMAHTLTICNVAPSAMVRECKLAYVTHAGVEIGVASTKAFTSQLAGLFLLTLALAQARGRLTPAQEAAHLKDCLLYTSICV